MSNIIKQLLIFLVIFMTCVQLRADCGDPRDCDPTQEGVTVYKHSKKIYYPDEGNIEANDCLVIWNKNDKELCFSMDTYTNNFNNCGIYGKAKRINNSEYRFTQKKCRLVFRFLKDKVVVNVTGPSGNLCVDDDFGGNCGMNASIDSATYLKVTGR